jgi:hypothetical protein
MVELKGSDLIVLSLNYWDTIHYPVIWLLEFVFGLEMNSIERPSGIEISLFYVVNILSIGLLTFLIISACNYISKK